MTADSPCTGVCRLDQADAFCVGCGRTVAEITAWSQLSEAGKQDVLAVLENRKATPEFQPATEATAALGKDKR